MHLDHIWQHALVAQWSPETRAAYQDFSDRLMRDDALRVKIGKGGLSYYHGAIFVCHFNAAPRNANAELGFADFRRDTLERVLDFPAALRDLQAALGPAIQINVGTIWHSFHFPLARRAEVADAFHEQIVLKLGAAQPRG